MKILAVDDSYFIRQYMKKCLMSLDPSIELTLAASGEEGFEQYLAIRPDLIFTDLLMPGIGGEGLGQQCENHRADCGYPEARTGRTGSSANHRFSEQACDTGLSFTGSCWHFGKGELTC
jgi:CheY-like chemotaxis protein